MATIGQQLTAPELGWQRIDNTNAKIIYTGGWTQAGNIPSGSQLYNNTDSYSKTIGDKIQFKFYGTKIRLLSYQLTDQAGINVKIDSIDYGNYSNYSSIGLGMILMFEKLALDLKIHEVLITIIDKAIIAPNATGNYYALDCIDIDDTGYMSTPVGQQLLAPESGWQRLDDTNNKIIYKGTWTRYSDPHYNGRLNESNIYGDTIKFKFYGTMFRLVYAKASNRDSNVIITIDGIQYNYNPYNSTLLYQIIVFEKIGLDLKVHDVVITKGTNSATYFGLDAIDIDSSGYLIDYNKYYLIKHDNSYYSINDTNYDSEIKAYLPLSLSGGTTPNANDISMYGFEDISKLSIDTTIGTETFKPIDKLANSFEVMLYKLV